MRLFTKSLPAILVCALTISVIGILIGTPVDVSNVQNNAFELSQVRSLSVGNVGNCVTDTSNSAKCWGWAAPLGDILPRSLPFLGGQIKRAVSGGNFGCALTTSDGVKCWGYKPDGGYGGAVAFDVPGFTSGVVDLALGNKQGCAVLASGAVKCWRLPEPGINPFDPYVVDGISDARMVSISAEYDFSYDHKCALTSNGGVKCWGSNHFGQLGIGTSGLGSGSAVEPIGLGSGVISLSVGGHTTCAVLSTGTLKCWGGNSWNGVNSNQPTDIAGLSSHVAQVALGWDSICVLFDAGGVKCWGRNNRGQLGDGTLTDRLVPEWVSGLTSGVAEIGLGSANACALMTDSTMRCWGVNLDGIGQAGDGINDGADRAVPVKVMQGYYISGTISSLSGPLAGVLVDGGDLGSTTTDASGAYTIRNILGGSGYRLTPSKTGYIFSPGNVSSIVVDDVVENFSAQIATPSPTQTPYSATPTPFPAVAQTPSETPTLVPTAAQTPMPLFEATPFASPLLNATIDGAIGIRRGPNVQVLVTTSHFGSEARVKLQLAASGTVLGSKKLDSNGTAVFKYAFGGRIIPKLKVVIGHQSKRVVVR